MATIYRKGKGWRAQVCVKGVRDSTVLPTKQEAAQWALHREAELGGRKLPDKTVADALRSYEAIVTPTRVDPRWEEVKVAWFHKDPIARRKLAGLNCDDLAAWRDARLLKVKPGTVAREMTLLRSVFEHVRKAPLRWIVSNPMQDVEWPETPPGRRRRVMPDEVAQVRLAFGLGSGYPSATQTNRVGLAFLFALETAMRSGEMIRLDWRDVKLAQRYVILRKTKNGDVREVPLTPEAITILRKLPGEVGPVFGITNKLRDALWRKNRPESLRDLNFHDSRGEAIWRLSKKLDILQLAQVIGHRDLKSLQIYYRATAEEMAMQLDSGAAARPPTRPARKASTASRR
jgi:integrase